MQYILTKEEYEDLLSRKTDFIKLEKEKLQKLCTHICNTMPANVEWRGVDKPWGCMLSTKGGWYCDGCPVGEICPYLYKKYSK